MKFVPERLITPSDCPVQVTGFTLDGVAYKVANRRPLGLELGPPVTLEQAKAQHVQHALDWHGWNVCEAAKALGKSRQWLARAIKRWALVEGEPPPAPAGTFKEANQLHVQHVLEGLAWNVTEAARVLGVHRRTLYRLLERWGIDRPGAPS